MAENDARIVAAAEVGSLTAGLGDRWSDLDLTFGVDPGSTIQTVLEDWTREMRSSFGASVLFDLPQLSTIYRVFLLPGNLQVDLSFTPAADFGPLGPKWRTLFGETVERAPLPPVDPHELFGYAVHGVLRARICIERGKPWAAEYWMSEARDLSLSLAALRLGLPPKYARGFDDLPASVVDGLERALPASIERQELLRALRHTIDLLSQEAGELMTPALAEQIAHLKDEEL